MYVTIGAVNSEQLAACDGCGRVSVLMLTDGWRGFTGRSDTGMTIDLHHCGDCAERNDLIGSGLVHGVDPSNAVTYDE